MKKKKILVISDSPLVPSGVGTQTKYMIEALLSTGEYKFLCLAGAIKHQNYDTFMVEGYLNDWLIKPVDGYGNKDIIRQMLKEYKPDILWFMTDPRFYVWLWEMENEIRANVPMVYYHVWDNYPYPDFNKPFYDSNDLICTISKVTDDIVRNVSPTVDCMRIPHTVDTNIFKNNRNLKETQEYRKSIVKDNDNKTVFFWNNRNARRKQSGTLIFWFKEFLDEVGHDKATLLMHTDPNDPHGQDLYAIAEYLKLSEHNQVLFSTDKFPPDTLSNIYSACDCTINISDAEGFGLSTLESLACEVPIIVNMTGGLQEQVTNGTDWFGVGINPSSKAVIGSQEVPYIREDRINKQDFISALKKIHNLTTEERQKLGSLGRKHVLDNYGLDQYKNLWIKAMKHVEEKYGSWSTRKGYKNWRFKKI